MASSASSPVRPRVMPEPAWGRGRPPKVLTEARLTAILDMVSQGVPPGSAAVASGVPRKTWQTWLRHGREDDAKEPYKGVAERLDAALQFYQVSRINLVSVGAEKDPRLAQWELERRFPADWADKSRGGAVTVNVGVLVASPEWVALRGRLLEALAPWPDALAAVGAALGGADVVEGDAVEVAELVSGG